MVGLPVTGFGIPGAGFRAAWPDRRGNGVRAGAKTLSRAGPLFDGTHFLPQQQGDPAEVAVLDGVLGGPHTITTRGFPELDGTPVGTLEPFGHLADTLAKSSENVVSAVAIRDLHKQEDHYTDVDELEPEESEVDDFLLSHDNDRHGPPARGKREDGVSAAGPPSACSAHQPPVHQLRITWGRGSETKAARNWV
jgi:hypothetical protein